MSHIMQKTTLVLLAFLFFWPLKAQKTEDIVSLANGSKIRGTVTEKNDSLVKIITCCGSIFVFPAGEVAGITQEKAWRPDRFIKKSGYMNFTTFGTLVGTSDDQKTAPFSVIMEHNYRFTEFTAVGAFIGFEQLNENLFPVGLNVKILFPAARSDLFISFLFGYSVSLEKPQEQFVTKATGGALAGIETGIMISVSQGSAITLAIGYRYNELRYRLEDWARGDYKRNLTFNRLSLRIGIAVF